MNKAMNKVMNKGMIWLIGGTSDSRAIAQRLSKAGIPWVATVTRPSAAQLYAQLPGAVVVGSLTTGTVPPFLEQWRIQGIVDASHPFAVHISQLAIAQAQAFGIPYLRFERPDDVDWQSPWVERIHTIQDIFQSHYLSQKRVFSTLGLKALPHFVPWLGSSQIWARILPQSLAEALSIGFPLSQLILEKLPVDPVSERQLWLALKLDYVLTKASGIAGGILLKQQLAQELGIRLLVVARPQLAYPKLTQEWDPVVRDCQKWLR